jgi:hypothetical protein
MLHAHLHRIVRPALLALLVAAHALPARAARAQNVDLSTIPQRDSVQLTIYNSEDLTLVRETRRVTFHKGLNPLQFSWAGTLIDPTSVDLRFPGRPKGLDVLDTTFPHDRPQMLTWIVRSEIDGEAAVEITYFTSGLTWQADYVCISDAAEEKMSFEGFVRITNHSGEDYADAQVRLVVGTINLVERVADLARRGIVSQEEKEAFEDRKLRFQQLPQAARSELADAVYAGVEAAASAPKEIVKQGLSEYFLYTIEGTETIRDQWSKRMRLFQGKEVPFRIAYRYRPEQYGDQLMRFYLLRNDEASELGTTPLPDGAVGVMRDNGRDGLSFLAAYMTPYVPIGQEIELNLGVDPRVAHERLLVKSWRDRFWFQSVRGQRYWSPDEGQRVERNDPVAGWDDHERRAERIHNDRDRAIEVELRFPIAGDVRLDTDAPVTLHDYRSPKFTFRVEPGEIKDLAYELTIRQGISHKQERVEIGG